VYCFVLSLRTVYGPILGLRNAYHFNNKTILVVSIYIKNIKIQHVACTGTIITENVSFVVFLDSFQCFDPNKPYFILINDEMPNTREQLRVVFLLYMSRLLCLLMKLFLFKVKLDVCVRYIFRTTYRPFA